MTSMKILTLIIFYAAMLILMLGCTQSTTTENMPPEKVRFVNKSVDSASVERGIDAEFPEDILPRPDKNGIWLEWFASNDDDIKSYDIYRRAIDTTGGFTKIAEVPQSFGQKDTTFFDTSVNIDTTYYYYIIAKDEADLEAEPSEKDRYKLLPMPEVLVTPVGGSLFNGVFQWRFSANFVAQYFIFRLEKIDVNNEYAPYYVGLLDTRGQTQPDQSWILGELGITSPLLTGRYRWRIDIRRFDPDKNREGAESYWETFEVQ